MADEEPGSVGLSNPGTPSDNRADLPGIDDFDQHVTQADVDRDLFAIALFEIKPIDLDDQTVLHRIGQTLLQFASPTTHLAYLGQNRFAMLSLTDDQTQRWVAPATSALRVTLDCWWAEESAYVATRRQLGVQLATEMDVSDLTERPSLMVGLARGLSRQVWTRAELALARAYKQQVPLAEILDSDYRRAVSPIEAVEPPAFFPSGFDSGTARATDDRLVVLSRRIEPVDRPEPLWHWLRLLPGLRAKPDRPAIPVELRGLPLREQALVEVWLAGQLVDLFADATTQLRVSVPLSAEACRARSFAQRIFPLLERHRIPPSRLVVEIDLSVISQVDTQNPDSVLPLSAPSAKRFIRDAAAVNVAVAVTGFDGGWRSWLELGDLPVNYLMPTPEMMDHAGQGDHGAIQGLVLLAAEADERGLELIAPDAGGPESGLSAEALSEIGFAYGEGTIIESSATKPSKGSSVPAP